jgi:hypothetical protein
MLSIVKDVFVKHTDEDKIKTQKKTPTKTNKQGKNKN